MTARSLKSTPAGGKPTLYSEPKQKKTILLTQTAIDKAEADAKAMGAGVSVSSAIETAIREFAATPLEEGVIDSPAATSEGRRPT